MGCEEWWPVGAGLELDHGRPGVTCPCLYLGVHLGASRQRDWTRGWGQGAQAEGEPQPGHGGGVLHEAFREQSWR